MDNSDRGFTPRNFWHGVVRSSARYSVPFIHFLVVAALLFSLVGGLAAAPEPGRAATPRPNARPGSEAPMTGPTVMVSPNYEEGGVGAVFNIGVVLANVASVYGAEFHLKFDPAKLQVVDKDPGKPGVQVTNGSFLAPYNLAANQPVPQAVEQTVNNATGFVSWAATLIGNPDPALAQPAVSGSGPLAIIEFQATGTGWAPLPLVNPLPGQPGVKVADNTGAPVIVDAVPGLIKVRPEAPRVEIPYHRVDPLAEITVPVYYAGNPPPSFFDVFVDFDSTKLRADRGTAPAVEINNAAGRVRLSGSPGQPPPSPTPGASPTPVIPPTATPPPTPTPTVTPAATQTPTPTPTPSVTPPPDGLPNLSQDGSKIVFDRDRDIYIMNNAPLAPATRLTGPGQGINTEPHFSYDGSRNFFMSDRDGGNQDIYVMDVSGGNLTRMTNHSARDFHPSFTPDGRIIFTSSRQGNNDLYIMDAVPNAAATGLTSNSAGYNHGRMKPTMTRIAFTSNRPGNNDIFKMDPSGADPPDLVNLTNYAFPDVHPDWILKQGTTSLVQSFPEQVKLSSVARPAGGPAKPVVALPKVELTPTPTPVFDPAGTYNSRCAVCHGPNREGGFGPPITAAALSERGRTVEWVTEKLTTGSMSVNTVGLTSAEISALANWLKGNPAATPTPSPTPLPSPTPGPATPTPTQAPTPTPTPTPGPLPSPTPTPTPDPLPSPTPSATPTPTPMPTPTPTPTPDPLPSPTPSATPPPPSPSPTPQMTPGPSPTPPQEVNYYLGDITFTATGPNGSQVPLIITINALKDASNQNMGAAILNGLVDILEHPAPPPTLTPSPTPVGQPTPTPSPSPTPQAQPTPTPSPTQPAQPTPTPSPTQPAQPTPSPSPTPQAQPTPTPSPSPAPPPTASPSPSPSPTAAPTATPSPSPSPSPTPAPTATPSPTPSGTPTPTPTPIPSNYARVEAGTVVVGPGGAVDVPITVKNIPPDPVDPQNKGGLGAYDFTVNFSSSVISVTNVLGGTFPFDSLLSKNLEVSGQVKFNAIQVAEMPGPTGDIVVARLRISGLGAAGDATPLTVTVTSLVDTNGDPIAAAAVHGSVTIFGAEFSASPTSGAAPLAVQFTDQTPGQPGSWSWNFGDGTGSSSQNPSHTYARGGNYDVSLTATAGTNSHTRTRTAYIKVIKADFSATPTGGTGPLTVNFTDLSSGTVTGWSWGFGDGTGSSVQNPSKTYNNVGTYNVGLTVTGPAGSSTLTRDAYINVTEFQHIPGFSQEAGSDGITYLNVNINRIRNPSTDETIQLTGGIRGFSFTLSYPGGTSGNAVNIMSARGAGAYTSVTPDIRNADGTSTFSSSLSSSSPQAPLTLAQVAPKIIGASGVTHDIVLSFNSLTDGAGGNVPAESTRTFRVRRGDARADNTITISDALFIAQMLAGLRNESFE